MLCVIPNSYGETPLFMHTYTQLCSHKCDSHRSTSAKATNHMHLLGWRFKTHQFSMQKKKRKVVDLNNVSWTHVQPLPRSHALRRSYHIGMMKMTCFFLLAATYAFVGQASGACTGVWDTYGETCSNGVCNDKNGAICQKKGVGFLAVNLCVVRCVQTPSPPYRAPPPSPPPYAYVPDAHVPVSYSRSTSECDTIVKVAYDAVFCRRQPPCGESAAAVPGRQQPPVVTVADSAGSGTVHHLPMLPLRSSPAIRTFSFSTHCYDSPCILAQPQLFLLVLFQMSR